MKIGSHFEFSKKQRNGVLILLVVVLLLQIAYFLIPYTYNKSTSQDKSLEEFQVALDSLKLIEKAKPRALLAPFNPNYLTDYRGYILGMSNEEIDRVLEYRSKNQWINSAKQFQEVSMISDSLLDAIAGYFNFPDFITNPKAPASRTPIGSKANSGSAVSSKIDLNNATRNDLIAVNGIGEKLADRILNYRNQQRQGFISILELNEIYGLSPEVIARVAERFYAETPPNFEKLNINTASRDQLVTIRYIDYEIAHKIIEYRTLHEGFKSLEELTKVKDFPNHKIDLIKLYLQID